MLRGKEILSTRDERYSQSWEKLQPFQQESLTDLQYYLGKQYTPDELAYLDDNDREAITNNKIRRAVNLVAGEQRLNRLSSLVLPVNDREMEEVATADQKSESIQFVCSKQGGYFHISDCFTGSLITAINFSEMHFDYSNDFDDGDIKFLRIPYNAMMWDPYFQNFDLSDCSYMMRRKYLSHVAAMGLLPDRAKEIKKLKPEKRDGKFPDIPFESNANGQPLLAYDEFWERDTKSVYFMVHMKTNTRIPFKDDTKRKRATEVVNDLNKQVNAEDWKLVTKYKAVVNLYVIIEGEVFYSGGDPNGIGDYPFTPFIAFHTPEYQEYDLNLQSFIRAARDPQRELNKRISKAIDMMDSRLYGGHYFKPSKLKDQDDVFHSGNHGNIALTDDAEIGRDIQPIVLPDVPASVFQMQNVFDENIMDVLNLNDAAFGVADKGNPSAFQTMLQQSSAMMGIQPIYDNLNRSQSIFTTKLSKMINKWSDEKIERITGRPPTKMFRDPDFSKFDFVTAQGILTSHQAQLHFAQLVELRAMGVEEITGAMLVRKAPIQDKASFMEEIEANAKAKAEQEQKMVEKINAQEELAMKLGNAEVVSKLGLAQERIARSKADVGLLIERTSEARQNQSQAVLNQAKTMTEIQDLNAERFKSSVEFVMALQEQARKQDAEELAAATVVAEEASLMPQAQSVGV